MPKSNRSANNKLDGTANQTDEHLSADHFQYSRRVNVRVAVAFKPCLRSSRAAFTAAFSDSNSPYSVDPDPDSDAYFDPARTSARFMSRSSGSCGKTTVSKSFSIPARTRSDSRLPARPPLLLAAGAPALGLPISHADSARPTSSQSIGRARVRQSAFGSCAIFRS